jgi:hypothetical protein
MSGIKSLTLVSMAHKLQVVNRVKYSNKRKRRVTNIVFVQ